MPDGRLTRTEVYNLTLTGLHTRRSAIIIGIVTQAPGYLFTPEGSMNMGLTHHSAKLSRRQFVALAAGINGFAVSAGAFADEPRPQGKIAFVSGAYADSRRRKIWIILPDGSGLRRLTEYNDDPGEYSPAWSPDGHRIAFSAIRDDNCRIYIRDSDGKNEICLTPNGPPGTDYEHPAWSRDAKSIAYCAYPPGRQQANIFVMSSDGTDQRQVTFGNDHYNWIPCFSSDGRRIFFETTRDGNREIYVMNVDGSNPTNLTKHPRNDHHPACSPDGQRVAFMTGRDQNNCEICVMNLDGSNINNLTRHPARDSEPAWSPYGDWLAFTRARGKFGNGPMDIYIMKADGSGSVNLTRGRPKADNWYPSWGND
jgi:Tol biopolymer transport system component